LLLRIKETAPEKAPIGNYQGETLLNDEVVELRLCLNTNKEDNEEIRETQVSRKICLDWIKGDQDPCPNNATRRGFMKTGKKR
jgi:hypothetical protein